MATTIDTGRVGDRPAERVLTRSCNWCGLPFEQIRRHQRYCRPSCRRAAFSQRPARPLFDDDSNDPGRPE